MKDCRLFAKCAHVIPNIEMFPEETYEWDSVFDYCPKCTKEIVAKQDELQETFDGTFNASNTEGE